MSLIQLRWASCIRKAVPKPLKVCNHLKMLKTKTRSLLLRMKVEVYRKLDRYLVKELGQVLKLLYKCKAH